jgi:hypothetical protein
MGAASELAFPAPDWLLRQFRGRAWPADSTSRRAPKVAAAGSEASKDCFLQFQMFGWGSGVRNVVGGGHAVQCQRCYPFVR